METKLYNAYEAAKQQLKKKIYQDIDGFLQDKDTLPSKEEYLDYRQSFLHQIWNNIWIQKATSVLSKEEKKNHLIENGIDVEGMERKLLGKVFRNEMKAYKPFNVREWLEAELKGKEHEWRQRYEKARESYLQREREIAIQKQFQSMREELVHFFKIMLNDTTHFCIYGYVFKWVYSFLRMTKQDELSN